MSSLLAMIDRMILIILCKQSKGVMQEGRCYFAESLGRDLKGMWKTLEAFEVKLAPYDA